MGHYTVAITKDKLSSLIDKARAGEEVIITRHGKPTATLSGVADVSENEMTKAEWIAWLRERRDRLPPLGVDAADLVRQMRDEGAH